jgi:hypothetical protein
MKQEVISNSTAPALQAQSSEFKPQHHQKKKKKKGQKNREKIISPIHSVGKCTGMKLDCYLLLHTKVYTNNFQ